ncbi:hypothetical protein ACFTWH_06085 [Streptomyces sp. NPDC057011]|uniref:hypothetical protein n=1 Tax=unclassified Streptomyces TaxID=2593676 RepID=UPI003636CD00
MTSAAAAMGAASEHLTPGRSPGPTKAATISSTAVGRNMNMPMTAPIWPQASRPVPTARHMRANARA